MSGPKAVIGKPFTGFSGARALLVPFKGALGSAPGSLAVLLASDIKTLLRGYRPGFRAAQFLVVESPPGRWRRYRVAGAVSLVLCRSLVQSSFGPRSLLLRP
ncbi:MAG: hypothetical protein AAGI37_21525 [Planctomycetota bacterium]